MDGKRLAFGPADSGWILFPAFASANGIDMSKIIQVSAGPASMRQLLLAKKVNTILNYFTSIPEMASRGADLTYLRYADYKVSLLGGGLIAHTETLKNRGAMLRKFVKATTKGFAEAMKDPEKSITGLMKRAPMTVSKKNIAIQNLKMSLSLLHTKRSKGKAIGWMDRKDWESTIHLLAKYRKMKPLAVDRYFTNAFSRRTEPLNPDRSAAFTQVPPLVIPAQAGIQKCFRSVPINLTSTCTEGLSPSRILLYSMITWAGGWTRGSERWIPACAGMTAWGGCLTAPVIEIAGTARPIKNRGSLTVPLH